MNKIEELGSKLNWCLVAVSSLVFIPQTKTLAQSNIVPDNTLGNEPSVVSPDPNNALIEQITGGVQRGQNLFHSFEEFNVGEGSAVYFSSPNADIANIASYGKQCLRNLWHVRHIRGITTRFISHQSQRNYLW